MHRTLALEAMRAERLGRRPILESGLPTLDPALCVLCCCLSCSLSRKPSFSRIRGMMAGKVKFSMSSSSSSASSSSSQSREHGSHRRWLQEDRDSDCSCSWGHRLCPYTNNVLLWVGTWCQTRTPYCFSYSDKHSVRHVHLIAIVIVTNIVSYLLL